MIGACRGCKRLAEIVYTDDLGQDHCAECTGDMPKPSEVLGLEYLVTQLPFVRGDRVECRTAGTMFDGVGEVVDVSFEIERGGGTLVYPAFLVKIDEPANEHSPERAYYTETCLTRVGARHDRT